MSVSFSLKSLGCARSLVDSEGMIDQLGKIGLSLVNEGSGEPISILNTCSFIQAAIDETERNIQQLIAKKKAGLLKYIVIAGCYPSRFKRQTLEEKFPEVDLWFSTQEEYQLQEKLAELVFQKKFTPKQESPYIKLTPKHYAYLKISEGCNNWCTFCTIPKIRGVHTSKSIEKIIAEAKLQIALGVKELILIAEDTTCWGEDIYGKACFPLLLNELSKLNILWIRVMYVFPSRVDDEFIATIKNNKKIINYIDMPIQHVNTTLLESMNRKHDKAHLERIISDMYKEMPDLSLRTTFITGFPGETDEHVAEICDFIEKYPFAQLGCFTYSKERETRSARFENEVPLDIAKKRLDTIMTHQYKLVQERLPKEINKTLTVIYEGNKLCRSYREAPEVDSLIVLDKDPNCDSGSVFDVRITGYSSYDLLAKKLT
jgi:ribosomal protein S12 methylthiotransferase